jgi:hypothetical protein
MRIQLGPLIRILLQESQKTSKKTIFHNFFLVNSFDFLVLINLGLDPKSEEDKSFKYAALFGNRRGNAVCGAGPFLFLKTTMDKFSVFDQT